MSITNIFVVSAKSARLADLVPGAVSLGGKVSVISAGQDEQTALAFGLGAQAVHAIPKQDGIIFEDYAPSIAAVIKAAGDNTLVLLPTDRRGKAMAAKLGALLNAAVVNEAASFDLTSGVTVNHLVYCGLAVGAEKSATPITIATVGGGMFEAQSAQAGAGTATAAAFVAPAKAMTLLETRAKAGSTVDLAKAKRVVCVGRGFGKQEDIELARQLAAVIDAEVGCTRPIAEGEHWMERERYIGVSSVSLKTDVYLGLGVSGQIQHMVGVNDSKVVIAVNKDKNAPIFKFADYGIVGDLYKILPALTAALKA